MTHMDLTPSDLAPWGALDGEYILPGQAGYERARLIWNGMFDKRPAVIIRCASPHDVGIGVALAREKGLPLAVRGGGHSAAGHSTVDDGVVLDLAPLHEVAIDLDRGIVAVGGGATWGQVDALTQEHGLAVPGGVYSKTGVGGLTLAGGYGWIRNTCGFSCASLVGAELVTADSAVVHTDSEHEPELLWALRGGGGNVGVVTRFEFAMHPVGPEVYFLFVFHDGRDGGIPRALRLFREFCAQAPNEASALAFAGLVPEGADGFAPETFGRPFTAFGGVFVGDPAVGAKAFRPLHEFGEPLFDGSGVTSYVQVQQAFDADYPPGDRHYWKSVQVERLGDEVIALIAEAAVRPASDLSTIDVWHLGGHTHDSIEGAMPVTSASFLISPEANWTEPGGDEANIAWARGLVAALHPFSNGVRYLNFAGFQEEGDELMRSSLGPNYQRLAEIKARWDPQNLFRLNQNVPPARG
ncbi:FAD-binding oxidoreductase [Microterricola viridarii]|uniref:FAD-binding PCMH-type domain-containing protein n=1 Tax=Microterricola viridarii TaxID=412690 RepID=A0A109QYQ3_9MICO|nr:FAD-binding oxidoreductase [Microterricola viridarii]AMB58800.1 hypothetical protein AWU67_07920 [Microterricola viridarii]